MKSLPRGKIRVKGKGGDERDRLWAGLKEKYELAMELRRPFEGQWLLNLSFLGGKQYAFYNQTAQLLQQVMQRKGRLRVVDNKILPRYRKQVSRLIKRRPRMSVVPGSTDQEDLKAAKIGDKVLRSFWQNNGVQKKVRVLAGWIYGCGNGFLDDRWNPKVGPMAPNEKGELEYQGDVDVGVWSPFEIGVPAGGLGDEDLHEMPWMIKMKFRGMDWFRKHYARGKEVEPEARPMPYVDTSVIFGTGGGRGTSHKVEGAVELQLYVQPNEEWPRGLYLVGANGVVLEKKDYPFDYYNLEQFKDIEIPGVFWGMATSEPAIWLQKLWNRTLSDIAEFNRVMARGKWLIPRNSQMEVAPDDSHGQRILYTPVMGFKPEMMTIKGLPVSYQQVLELLANSLMELYHQHEVSFGTNRSDIRSGEMVELLQDADNEGNIPTHAVFEESLERVMKRVLQRIQKGYGSERVLSIVGKNNEIEVFSFKGAMLRDNTDVRVEKQSSLPDSRAARQARIKEHWKEGLYGDPMEEGVRERVLRMLDEVPEDMEDIFKESHLDRENAKVENQAMASQPGVVYLVNSYDNHQVHVREHNYFRKQPEYQKLKFEDPKRFWLVESTIMKHMEFHQRFIKEEMEAQLEQMAKVEEVRKGAKG